MSNLHFQHYPGLVISEIYGYHICVCVRVVEIVVCGCVALLATGDWWLMRLAGLLGGHSGVCLCVCVCGIAGA